jgi:hypothetical protein
MGAFLTRTVILAGLTAAAAGCAGDGGTYPSLALRPFERGETPAPATLPPAAAPIRPETPPARIAELRAAAEESHAAFVRQEPGAAQLARAAAGQSADSSARAAALMAIAELDAARARTASTLAKVDVLAAEAAGALAPEPALGAVQTELAALLARQDEGIARIWEAMGS